MEQIEGQISFPDEAVRILNHEHQENSLSRRRGGLLSRLIGRRVLVRAINDFTALIELSIAERELSFHEFTEHFSEANYRIESLVESGSISVKKQQVALRRLLDEPQLFTESGEPNITLDILELDYLKLSTTDK